MDSNSLLRSVTLTFILVFQCSWSISAVCALADKTGYRILLEGGSILVDPREPSYVQYGANDLGAYLSEISGARFSVGASEDGASNSKLIIAVGQKVAKTLGIDLKPEVGLGDEGAVIRDVKREESHIVVVAGSTPRGTNLGIATLLRLVHADVQVPYFEAAESSKQA